MADQLIRLESYPFDSNTPTVYDELGYPIFDRGITSYILAACWKQFFSDGIFGTPANCLQITKGNGLNINIAKGVGIIEGHMGGVFDDEGLTIELSDEMIRRTTTYSVFLRYDNNIEYRSTYIHITDEISPVYPEEAPSVKEYRIGYITVPSNSIDLTNATITDERGTSMCPYAAPFEEIDVSNVIADVKQQANIQYASFVKFLNDNIEFINQAMSGEALGALQTQINNRVQYADFLSDYDFLNTVFPEGA